MNKNKLKPKFFLKTNSKKAELSEVTIGIIIILVIIFIGLAIFFGIAKDFKSSIGF